MREREREREREEEEKDTRGREKGEGKGDEQPDHVPSKAWLSVFLLSCSQTMGPTLFKNSFSSYHVETTEHTHQ